MGNSYCKNNKCDGEVSIVKITEIRLQTMKTNVAIPRFYCLVSKKYKKIVLYIYVFTGRKKAPGCVVSKAQKN